MEDVVLTTVTVDKLGPCKRRINVEVPSEKINSMIEEIYRDLEKTAKIPGFRIGKVPA